MKRFLKSEKTLKLLSVALAVLLWQILAWVIGEELLLASPLAVLKRFFTVWREGAFFASLWFSFSRIAIGFFAAWLVGAPLAILGARYSWVKTLLYPYMTAVKTVPVAALIVIAFVWFSSATLSSFICFLIVLPTVYESVMAAMGSVDVKMKEMARVFRLSPLKTFVAVYLPSAAPHLLSAVSLGAGLAFKSGIAAEIIAVPKNASIGEMIYYAKLYLETTDLYVWTLFIVLMSVLFEKGLTKLLSISLRALFRALSPQADGVALAPQKTSDAPALLLENVNKSYEKTRVLQKFSMTAEAGSKTALMGASGVGKTTVLRLLSSLESAEDGEWSRPYASVVFQEDRLSGELSAVGNAMLGSPRAKAGEAVGMLSLLGLAGHIDKPVCELSGGMRRRVAIARALLSDAPVLLLDEPFKGLDEETKRVVIDVVKTYTEGKTVLLVTHDEEEARLLCARVVTI